MQTSELDVRVSRFYKTDNLKNLKGFADIVLNDVILIKGIKLVEGRDGMFIVMPQEQSKKDQKWYDRVRCLDTKTRQAVVEAVTEAYESHK